MDSQISDLVAISGAKGFVGKNLGKFLSQQNIQSISISRNHFNKNKNDKYNKNNE